MVKDNSDSERGNLLAPLHWLLFLIRHKESFIGTIPWPLIHNVEHWLEKQIIICDIFSSITLCKYLCDFSELPLLLKITK